MENPKKWQRVGKINPENSEFHINWLLDTLKCVLDNLQMCVSCLNKDLLRHCLDSQNSCLRYLKIGFVSCLGSILETLLRCIWDVFAKKLSFRHLENISAKCLAVLARQLLDNLQMSFGLLNLPSLYNWCLQIFWCIRSSNHS